MRQYLLSVYHPEDATLEPEAIQKIRADVAALDAELQQSACVGLRRGPARPARPPCRRRRRRRIITDGPFAEGKEHIGGIWVISSHLAARHGVARPRVVNKM